MNCVLCGGHINLIQKSYFFDTKELGVVEVPNVTFYQCDTCKDESLSEVEAAKVDKIISAAISKAISALPVGKFITTNEAVNMLSITKQAFSKNKRIKRGFIYSIKIGNQKLYYTPSVEAFKAYQDGRIRLVETSTSAAKLPPRFANLPEFKESDVALALYLGSTNLRPINYSVHNDSFRDTDEPMVLRRVPEVYPVTENEVDPSTQNEVMLLTNSVSTSEAAIH